MHELAHVRSGDWAFYVAGRAVCALLWFHPGVWWIARALREDCEQACDDRVIASGVRRSDYAELLVRVAERDVLPTTAALALARRRGLRGRLAAVLDVAHDVRPMARGRAIAAVLVAMTVGGAHQRRAARADARRAHEPHAQRAMGIARVRRARPGRAGGFRGGRAKRRRARSQSARARVGAIRARPPRRAAGARSSDSRAVAARPPDNHMTFVARRSLAPRSRERKFIYSAAQRPRARRWLRGSRARRHHGLGAVAGPRVLRADSARDLEAPARRSRRTTPTRRPTRAAAILSVSCSRSIS